MMAKIKQFVPAPIMLIYHKTLAILADFYFGSPSKKLIVIGVTGTNGKTTTVSLIARVLEGAGFKVGAASTAIFKIGEKEILNDKKMTMLGRFALQKMLSDMVSAGCDYAVVETSSQGVEQFRHIGIHYDIGVFTNLTPEHIEAHGGFENYKKAKLKFFRHLESLPHKFLRGKKIAKAIVANTDDKFAPEFLDFKVDKNITFGIDSVAEIKADNISYSSGGVGFSISAMDFDLKLFGKFNIYNSLAAIAVGESQGVSIEKCREALSGVTVMPGRMEFISEAVDFNVLVDYAPEPESLRQMFETIKLHKLIKEGGRIIHVFGSCGGGRDTARRPILGEISAKNADIQIITNEDPYDDDPNTIIDQVADGAIAAGKIIDQSVFKILDRREAIRYALKSARAGDLVILTGKGSEQAICVENGKKIKWDDRQVAREELSLLN